MPSKFVQNTAERMGVSVEHAEKVWHEAKAAVKKGKRQGSWYWGKVVNTFKRMMGIKNEGMTFSDYLLLEAELPMPRFIKLAGPYVAEKKEETIQYATYQVKDMMGDNHYRLRITVWFGTPNNTETPGMWTFRPDTTQGPVPEHWRTIINAEKTDMSSLGVRNAKHITAWARRHMQEIIDSGIMPELVVQSK